MNVEIGRMGWVIVSQRKQSKRSIGRKASSGQFVTVRARRDAAKYEPPMRAKTNLSVSQIVGGSTEASRKHR